MTDRRRGWIQELVAPTGAEAGYLTGIQVTELMHDAAMAYLTAAMDVTVLQDIGTLPVRPVLRGMTSQFEAPLLSEQPVRVQIRVDARSERSFVLGQAAHLSLDEQLVARGTMTLVMIDAATHRSTAVPAEVWSRMIDLDEVANLPEIESELHLK